MRTLWLVTLIVAVLVWSLLNVAWVAAAGNRDAAHACQDGGYATLQGSDGRLFKNAGECSAYAARGGTITNIGSACAVSAASGCIDYRGVVATEFFGAGSYGTHVYTINGITSFNFVCGTPCGAPNPPDADGGGQLLLNGTTYTWSVTHLDNLISPAFTDGSFNPTTCSAAAIRQVIVDVEVLDSSSAVVGGGWMETRSDSTSTAFGKNFVELYLAVGPAAGFFLQDGLTGTTISC